MIDIFYFGRIITSLNNDFENIRVFRGTNGVHQLHDMVSTEN
jgi:hypothetical protein